jgi:hypothetical protein
MQREEGNSVRFRFGREIGGGKGGADREGEMAFLGFDVVKCWVMGPST